MEPRDIEVRSEPVTPPVHALTEGELELRGTLVTMEQRSQEAADQTLVALSGGALGVSFAFVPQMLERGGLVDGAALIVAWVAWAISLVALLASHQASVAAMRKSVEQIDAGKLHTEPLGGAFDTWLVRLNAVGLPAFTIGLLAFGVFVLRNLFT